MLNYKELVRVEPGSSLNSTLPVSLGRWTAKQKFPKTKCRLPEVVDDCGIFVCTIQMAKQLHMVVLTNNLDFHRSVQY